MIRPLTAPSPGGMSDSSPAIWACAPVAAKMNALEKMKRRGIGHYVFQEK
jgi:hypothetical protein